MGLLDQIKKQTKKETVSENHPVCKLDFEGKFNYLRGLALFIVIDEKITDNEKSLWKELIKIFNCGEFEEQLNEFLENPDISELDDIMNSIKNVKVAHLFLLDSLLICYSDADYANKEKELLEVFNDKLGVIKSEVEYLEKFAKAVSKKDYQAIVAAFNNILKESIVDINTEHLDYFLVDFDERKELNRIIEGVEFEKGTGGMLSAFTGNSRNLKVKYIHSNLNKDYSFSVLLKIYDDKNKFIDFYIEEFNLTETNSSENFPVEKLKNGKYKVEVFINAVEKGSAEIEIEEDDRLDGILVEVRKIS